MVLHNRHSLRSTCQKSHFIWRWLFFRFYFKGVIFRIWTEWAHDSVSQWSPWPWSLYGLGPRITLGGGGGRHSRLSSAQLDFVAPHECEHSWTANWDWSQPPRLPEVSFTSEGTVMRWLTLHLTKTVTLGMTRHGAGEDGSGVQRDRSGRVWTSAADDSSK